ncbi:aminotransferase DegT [Anaerobacillus alkalilacustris]|uniref:Aminotransferase DegT n=1 Tax=Anaerobacillus alkalilacustris TaxID=393763 RepID=A0A1S2LX46_9BACI|nr:LegC family aminotransferase [Anaerobacillus alkalilacustris]OIJ16760.1 aminotransferase DegT [Anaerobacillus alkalilacustris]
MSKKLNPKDLVSRLEMVLQKNDEIVPLHEPLFTGNEWTYVKNCLDTGWVSSVGKYVDLFEQKLVQYTGVNYAIAVVNGTAALHICLKLIGVEQGDEVLLPALTFVATANAVHYCGAIPHFIDSEYESLGIHPSKLADYLAEITEMKNGVCYNKKTMRPIKAVIAVHTFGHSVDLDPLLDICQKYRLELIEDAAESLGSYYKKQHTGNFGKVSALSFNGNKIITTGGGGAILTNDVNIALQAKHITTTAKLPHRWSFNHDHVGYNYRLPNINAAIGCAQLEQIEHYIQSKRALAKKYEKAFASVKGISFFKEPNYARSNYWLNCLLLDKHFVDSRESLLQATHDKGILTRPAWTLMNKLPMNQNCPRMDLSVAESLEQRMINIPSSVNLGGYGG